MENQKAQASLQFFISLLHHPDPWIMKAAIANLAEVARFIPEVAKGVILDTLEKILLKIVQRFWRKLIFRQPTLNSPGD